MSLERNTSKKINQNNLSSSKPIVNKNNLIFISPFALSHDRYSKEGYHVVPIGHETKKPCYLKPDGSWGAMSWRRYAAQRPSASECRIWAGWTDAEGNGAGIGICLGTPAGFSLDGEACVTAAIDFDPAPDCPHEAELLAAVLASVPEAWAKKGAKGATFLVRVRADDTAEGFDFAAPGGHKVQFLLNAQTVMPPSVHPTTGKPYKRLGDNTRQPAAELPLVTLAALSAVLATFGYARNVRRGVVADSVAEAVVREDIALSDIRPDLLDALDIAPGDLGALWRLGGEAPLMLKPTKAGKERDASGSGLRLALARQMALSGYGAAEFKEAVELWDHAEGDNQVKERDIVRAWAAAGMPVRKAAVEAAKIPKKPGPFSPVEDPDELATPEAKAVLDPQMARYAARYPKVIEGKEVKIARWHHLSDGSVEIDLIAPVKFRDFVPDDWVDVPTKQGTRRVHLADLYMKTEVKLLRGQRFFPGLTQAECPDHLNTWTGWGVRPSAAGSCEAFKRHLLERVCGGDAEYMAYLWRWMAHIFQKPRIKPGVAVIIQGGKGCGKTLVGSVLGKLIGLKHYLLVKDREHVLGKFNAQQADAILIQMEEAVWARDPKGEGVLKSLITESTMQVERKGLDAVTAPSYLRILMTSNEAFVVPATEGERRFFVLKMTNPNIVGELVETIIRELNAGGYARLLFELQAVDLTGFNPMRPPSTEALAEQVRHNRSVIEVILRRTPRRCGPDQAA